MIPRCIIGRGVTGAVRYILGEGRNPATGELLGKRADGSRVAWFSGTGFPFRIEIEEDADLARRMMEFAALNQASRTRRCEKDCVHVALGWRPGETPTREEMEAAGLEALKALGMENAQALFAAHTDMGYAHLHIVASKINPATGRAYDMRGNYIKLSRWAEQYERLHGGVICLQREKANRLRDAIAARDPAAVLEAITEQRSTFTEAFLEQALAKQMKGALGRAQFAEKILSHPEVVKLSDREGGPITRFTTRTVLKAEAHVLCAAEDLRKDIRHDAGDAARANILAAKELASIRPDQKEAFRRATGAEGLALIDGQAGTGKSFTMAAIRHAYEAAGRTVIGLAPTNAVAQDMHKDGFRHAATVHSELFVLNNARTRWNARTVVMVDEAAMLDTKLVAMVTAHAHAAGAKLILVGDDRQLASIQRGGMFGSLKDRYGAAELREVMRQRKDDDRRAASMMAEGNFHDALAMYEAKGAIKWTRTQGQARGELAKQWARDVAAAPGKTRFVFAYTNADVAELNRLLRSVQRQRGALGDDHLLPTADGIVPFAVGERVQFTGTDKKIGLFNGAVATIEKIEDTRVSVLLDGRLALRRTFDAKGFQDFRYGYAGTIYRGQGRTLDQTYLYHSRHWRSAASYVALTRHRDKAELFVARETAPDVRELARQMARVDDHRAASQFHHRETNLPERPMKPSELLAELGGINFSHELAEKEVAKAERLREFQALLDKNFDRSKDRDRGRSR